MKTLLNTIFFSVVIVLISCNTNKVKDKKDPIKESTNIIEKKETKADVIINKAIQAHGGKLYSEASYSFVFRKKAYSFTNTENSYTYSVKKQQDDKEVIDVLTNGNLTRTINGKQIDLTSKDQSRYSESLNSVIYFATLPYKLNDTAVNRKYKGETIIKGIKYHVIEVTFKKEGGGKDFDDEFHYWVNMKTNTIDYLAYNYRVNNGGVRFRSAYNRRNIDGIIFQDYINYKAEVGTALEDLPALYEKGELKELSKIETEDVVSLKN